MKTISTRQLEQEGGSNLLHAWLFQEKLRLAHKVGEPIFVTIRLVYDGSVEVDVETFAGRHGMASGDLLAETLVAAVDCLLYLDKITGLSPQEKLDDLSELNPNLY